MHIFDSLSAYLKWTRDSPAKVGTIENGCLSINAFRHSCFVGYYTTDDQGVKCGHILKNRLTGKMGVVSLEDFAEAASQALPHVLKT